MEWVRLVGVRHGAVIGSSASFVIAERPICAFDPSGIAPVIVAPSRGPFPPIPSEAAGVNQGAGSANCAWRDGCVIAVRAPLFMFAFIAR